MCEYQSFNPETIIRLFLNNALECMCSRCKMVISYFLMRKNESTPEMIGKDLAYAEYKCSSVK